jgi:hypothetical protein
MNYDNLHRKIINEQSKKWKGYPLDKILEEQHIAYRNHPKYEEMESAKNEQQRKNAERGSMLGESWENKCTAGCIAGTSIGCMACGTGTPAGCVAGACGGITGAVLGDNLHDYMYPPVDTKKMDRGGKRKSHRRRKSHRIRKSHRRRRSHIRK